jgi:outer membrane autotransporter protein
LIQMGSELSMASSDHDANAIAFYAETGWEIDFEPWRLVPFFSLQYQYLDEDGFAETGAAAANLVVDPRKTNFLLSELGLQVARPWRSQRGSWIPRFAASWVHGYDVDDRVITARLSGAPTGFSVPAWSTSSNGARLSASLEFIGNERFGASVRIDSELRRNYWDVGGGVQFSVRF